MSFLHETEDLSRDESNKFLKMSLNFYHRLLEECTHNNNNNNGFWFSTASEYLFESLTQH
jgi:hypothetical protein